MKRALQFILIGLVLGIVWGAISHTPLAQGEVRLIPTATGGTDTNTLAIDLGTKFIILGTPGSQQNFATIFEGAGDDWKERANLTGAGGAFGTSVAITDNRGSADLAIVGAPKEDVVGGNSGAAYIFGLSGRNWKLESKLRPTDLAEGDEFGHAVDIDATTAIIGAPKDDDTGGNSGAAYIFVRQGGGWKQQAKLVPADPERSAGFGEHVAILASTVVVGSPQSTHAGVKFAGAVYIFERRGDRWTETAKLTDDDPGKADRFGNEVAIGAGTIVIGSPRDDTKDGQDAGSVTIFKLNGDRWQRQAKVFGGDSRKNDQFGTGLATNGNIVMVGAPIRDEDAFGAGAVYAFARVDGVWQAKEKVVAKDEAKDLHFGFSVAMHINTVAISSHHKPKCDGPCSWQHGDGSSAYVYNSVKDFETPPFAVEPFGRKVTTLGRVKHTALYQNFPNPFNPETWLPYHLATDAPVTFRIYNVQGQLTRELNLGTQNAGGYLTHETAAHWDGRDQVGETVSSGVYFYTLQAGAFQATRRMLILK